MNGIVEKMADAVLMFWQSLEDRERRLVVIGGLWVAATAISVVTGKHREALIVARVADEVERRGAR